MMSQRQGQPITIPDFLPAELSKVSLDLAAWVADGKATPDQLVSVLGRLAELGYVTTGNGYYLYTRGAIKV